VVDNDFLGGSGTDLALGVKITGLIVVYVAQKLK
jgi:hypothetical protein